MFHHVKLFLCIICKCNLNYVLTIGLFTMSMQLWFPNKILLDLMYNDSCEYSYFWMIKYECAVFTITASLMYFFMLLVFIICLEDLLPCRNLYGKKIS